MNGVLDTARDLAAKHPLTLLAVFALGGIVTADYYPHEWKWFGVVGLACLAVGFWVPSRLLAFMAAFCVFAVHHSFRWHETFGHPLRGLQVGDEGVAVEAQGTFLSGPTAAGSGLSPNVMFRAEEILLPAGQKITGQTDLKLTGSVFARRFVAKGGLHRLAGTLYLSRLPLNPVDRDLTAYQLRSGIVGTLRVSVVHQVQPSFSLRLWLLERAERCRSWIAQQVSLGLEDDAETTAILQTMALGTAATDTAELERPFVESGTMHVFAVSGLHVGLIGVMAWMVLKAVRVRRNPALIILIPLVLGYAYVTGWRPSAARAACMMTLMVMAPLFLRRGRIVNALGLSALLLWIVDSHEVYDVGFQLSFFVLWAIVAFAEPFTTPFSIWADIDELLPAKLANWWERFTCHVRKGFVAMSATSVAAWAGSAPLMFIHFQTVTLIGLLANLVLVPLSFLALASICLSLLAAGVGLERTQRGLNHASWAVAKMMTWSASLFAAVPYGHMDFPQQVDDDENGPMLVFPTLGLMESAALLKTNGKNWMLDCGSRRSFTRVLEPLLRQREVKTLEGVILSHADAEHAGGAASLFDTIPVRRLIVPMHEPWRLDSRTTTLWRLMREPKAAGAELFRAQAGEVFDLTTAASMQVLYPKPEDIADRADDRAMVARIDIGGMRLLWMNDAGLATEKHLLERMLKRDLRATVLWRSRHEGDVSGLPEFLAAVKPKVIIASSDEDDPAGRQPDWLVEYCKATGVHLLNLQECGQITLRVLPEGIRLHTFASDHSFTITP